MLTEDQLQKCPCCGAERTNIQKLNTGGWLCLKCDTPLTLTWIWEQNEDRLDRSGKGDGL